jgi:hypothetical protein
VLRAMIVPGGEHTIEFKFEPQVSQKREVLLPISAVGMLLLLGGGIYYKEENLRMSINDFFDLGALRLVFIIHSLIL